MELEFGRCTFDSYSVTMSLPSSCIYVCVEILQNTKFMLLRDFSISQNDPFYHSKNVPEKVIIKDERIKIYFRPLRMIAPYESSDHVVLVALSSSLGYSLLKLHSRRSHNFHTKQNHRLPVDVFISRLRIFRCLYYTYFYS